MGELQHQQSEVDTDTIYEKYDAIPILKNQK